MGKRPRRPGEFALGSPDEDESRKGSRQTTTEEGPRSNENEKRAREGGLATQLTKPTEGIEMKK